MDFSLIILLVIALGYIGVMIYLANQDDLARARVNPAGNSTRMFGSQELAAQQRSTILRWMLYGTVAINLVLSLFILQLSLLGNAPDMMRELQQLEVELPQVDQGGAVAGFVLALVLGLLSLRVVLSETARQRIKTLIGGSGLYNPDSSVHTVAIVLSLIFVSLIFSQLIASGGQSGLEQQLEAEGVSLGGLVFQAALMVVVAFLGVGLAIRRTGSQSLERLGLRLPTSQDVLWGVGAGIILFILLLIMAAIWERFVPLEQIQEQNAVAEQIAQSFNTLPLAFLLSLAAALSEEILFRGALQPIFGLIPTSILFALLHIQYTLTPATLIILVVAFGLGWVRKRQSTSAAIIAHFVYNFVQLALAILAAGLLGSNP